MTIFSISDADLLYLLIIYTNSKEVRIAERKKKKIKTLMNANYKTNLNHVK